MGIGFVVVFWLFIFAALVAIYLSLHLLAKENEGAADLKKAFLALLGIGVVSVICLIIFMVGNVCLDYFYPSRIFTKNFGFEPTADVRIIEGSSFWSPLGYSTHLKFQANEETVQKIVLQGFSERSRNYKDNFSSIETKRILEKPRSRYYEKNYSAAETLVYDKESQNAYFSLHTID